MRTEQKRRDFKRLGLNGDESFADPVLFGHNMAMSLICINDLRNNSKITISQILRHDLLENFSPFILFFWLVLWSHDYLVSIVGKCLLLKNFND